MRRGRELISGGIRCSRAIVHARIFGKGGNNGSPSASSCASFGALHFNEPTAGRWSYSSCTSIASALSNTRRLTSAASSTRHQRLIKETQRWLDDIVIGQKLCPFAPPVRSPPQLRMVVPDATTGADEHELLLEQISTETDLLVEGLKNTRDDSDNDDVKYPETTLIILDTEIYPSLGDYRNLIQLSWRVQLECIVDRGHSDHLQVVLFHPLAVHDTYTEQPPVSGYDASDKEQQVEDCADYTIRSPHPTIHLLRQMDVMRAVQSGYADLEGLPSRNKAKLRRDGIEVCRKRFEACSVNN